MLRLSILCYWEITTNEIVNAVIQLLNNWVPGVQITCVILVLVWCDVRTLLNNFFFAVCRPVFTKHNSFSKVPLLNIEESIAKYFRSHWLFCIFFTWPHYNGRRRSHRARPGITHVWNHYLDPNLLKRWSNHMWSLVGFVLFPLRWKTFDS